ncbi:hypothetical protein Tco_1536303 [Tanacetum coccineum]
MTTINRLRAMDERLGDIETDISRLVGDVDELTYVGVNFMSSTPIYSTAPSFSLTHLVCLVMPTQDVTSVYISMFAANKCVLEGNLSSATHYDINTFGVMP